MGMLICGVAACQALDSSGEVLDIEGLDISTLERDGVANYEHEEKLADQIVGKIIKAWKIFDAEDCRTDQELEHWNRIQVPFLWVIIELFDDLGHSGAENVAAMMRYDERQRHERGGYPDGMKPVVNFSIQGGKLDKQGNVVKHSLARKVSITVTPCSKVAEAEQYRPTKTGIEDKKSAKISDTRSFLSSMFKAENFEVLEMNKSENQWQHSRPTSSEANKMGAPKGSQLWIHRSSGMGIAHHPKATKGKYELYKKNSKISEHSTLAEAKMAHDAQHEMNKSEAPIFPTKLATGKAISPTGHHTAYSEGFTAEEHREAGNHHFAAAQAAKDHKTRQHHTNQAKFHLGLAGRKSSAWSSRHSAATKPLRAKQSPMPSDGKQPGYGKLHDPEISGKVSPAPSMKKSLDAGSPGGAPGSLTQGAALQKEQLDKKIQRLDKAEAEASVAVATWEKAEDFRRFLAERRPGMTPAEREAFTKVFALYRVKPQKNRLT